MLDQIHANYLEAGHRVVHDSILGAAAEERYGWQLIDAGRPTMPSLNAAVPLTCVGVDSVADVERWFSDRDSAALFRLRTDGDQETIRHLLERGYRIERIEPLLYMERPEPRDTATPLSIVEVQTLSQLAEISSEVFGDEPPGEFAIAIGRKTVSMDLSAELWGLLDGKLVAGAVVLVTGSIAGIYAVGVEEPWRRRGFGTAITWAAIQTGLSLGAKSAWLGSTPMALPMYLKMGFRQVGEYRMLSRP